jgi:hypothetical protein
MKKTTKQTKIDNSSGPNLYARDENGLLQNHQYEFNDDGSINWRAMIKDEHLFPNRSWFQTRGKDYPKTIEGLADHQLLIKLSGIKELAKLRGFSSVNYKTVKCEEDHVAVSCSITFLANYETNNEPIVFEDMANATLNNTSSFATKFLETIACNRSFVRCVRNFLNVHIVGDDEIDKSNNTQQNLTQRETEAQSNSDISPAGILASLAKDKFGINNYTDFKSKLRELWQNDLYKNADTKNWSDFSDIPPKEARALLKALHSS